MKGDCTKSAALESALETIEKCFGPIARGRVAHKWDGPITDLERLAKIPTKSSSPFRSLIFCLLLGAEQTASFRKAAVNDRHLKRAEDALRTAYDTVRAMSAPQRAIFEKAFLVAGACKELVNEDVPPGTLGLSVLEALVAAFATMSGKSPTFEPRIGAKRPKGTVGDWQFRQFVGCLWQTVNQHGGMLSFNCHANEGSGTLVEALKIIRPLLPDLIPSELSAKAKTIERIKRSLATETYAGFNFMQA